MVVLVTSPEPFRNPAYEIFLRVHQALATVILFATWRHVVDKTTFPSLYVYIMAGICGGTTALEIAFIIWQNFAFRRPYPSAYITKIEGAVRMSLTTPRPWKFKAGQYINIWIPSIAFWSSHPFAIVSWSNGKDPYLNFLIEPKDGFTNSLLARASQVTKEPSMSDHRLAFFSGPHGSPESFGEYGSVLMVASGFGIAALLPHAQELIRGFNRCETRTRRIHLVWLLQQTGNLTACALCGPTNKHQVTRRLRRICLTIC